MQEFWINSNDDLNEFKSYLNEEGLNPTLVEKTDSESIYTVQNFRVYVPAQFKLGLESTEQPKYDKLIFGKDSTENITNITIEDGVAHVYRKDSSPLRIPYSTWAVGSQWADGCRKLSGNQYYKYIRDITIDQYHHLQSSWNSNVWTPRTLEEGFMLKEGFTYYKGMKVDEVSLLSFDIEATGLDPEADDAEAPLVSITYRDDAGIVSRKLFDIFDYEQPAMMWDAINDYVQTKDPDIILGHNILGYDLPYLRKVGGLKWGRDGSAVRFNEKVSKVRKSKAQQYDFHDVTIHGRDVVDTFFLCMKYDISNDFPSYGLKAVERHLKIVEEDRSWDFKKWPVRKLINERKAGTELGIKMWDEFRQYCADDSDSPIEIFDKCIPAFFYLTQSVPKTLQQVINQASGSQLDAVMIRSYLQDGKSLPRSSKKKKYDGAISMGIPGYYENVRKVDVASLYPSIMLQYKIYDKRKDPDCHMLKILSYYRDERLDNKELAATTGEKYYSDLEQAQKIVINSMYGFLGAGYLLFNFPEGAAEVTKHGREILLKGVEWATGHTLKKVVKSITNKGKENEKEKYEWILGERVSEGLGYRLVNVDTDAFAVCNTVVPTKESFAEEIDRLNSIYPEYIKWEDDGVYDIFLVIKAKNYVMKKNKNWCKPKELDENGESIFKKKGASITDTKKETALLEFINGFIDNILADQDVSTTKNIGLYNKYCKEAADIIDINRWTTKKTVTKPILNPERANEQKPKDAIDEAIEKGIIDGIQEGDKIWVYTAIDGTKQKMVKGVPQFYKSKARKGEPMLVEKSINRFPELWNGKDHDKWHYVGRVHATLELFESIIDDEQYPNYSAKKKRKLLEEI